MKIKQEGKSWLFGLIQWQYAVFNLQPDLKQELSEYVHVIELWVFGKVYLWNIDSILPYPDNPTEFTRKKYGKY